MTETASHVVLRSASGPYSHLYAHAGEKTYCARGHLLGRFTKDAYAGALPAGELEPEPPMKIGAQDCPHCGAEVMGPPGIYYFEFQT